VNTGSFLPSFGSMRGFSVVVACLWLTAEKVSCEDTLQNFSAAKGKFSSVVDEEISLRLRTLENRLRMCTLPAFRRDWVWELLPAEQEEMHLQILPLQNPLLLQVRMPLQQVLREGELEKALGLVAAALCILEDKDNATPKEVILPHWLTLGWKGWLQTQHHAAYQQVVANAKVTHRVPSLEQILLWRKEEFSQLEEDFRTAFSFWLLRSLLREPQLAGDFFRALQRGVSEAGKILPRSWWNERVAEARGDRRQTPFLSKAETRQLLVELIRCAPNLTAIPMDPLVKNKPQLLRREQPSEDRTQVMATENKLNRPNKTLPTRLYSGRTPGNAQKNEEAANSFPKSKDKTALPARIATNTAWLPPSRSCEQSLVDLVRSGRNRLSLQLVRYARYVAAELAAMGSPVYLDATSRLVTALLALEKRWDCDLFEREVEMVLQEIDKLQQSEKMVEEALDWAETVFYGTGRNPSVEDFLLWQQQQQQELATGEKVFDIIRWRKQIARFETSPLRP